MGSTKIIQIPDGITVDIQGDEIIVKSNGKELRRKFKPKQIKIEKKDRTIQIDPISSRSKHRAYAGTIWAHINNMIKGVTDGFEYELAVHFEHFPMRVNTQGNQVVIENFLGSKTKRFAKILDGVQVKVDGKKIIVKGIDKEKTGQTAANIELATKQNNLCDRKFIDGIYIVKKP